MARVRRIDIGQLAKPVKRPDGTLIVQAKLARSGVYSYADATMPGGVRREYRPPANVFNKDSLESFKLVPITNDHPPEMITSENARQYTVGAVGQDIHRDGDWMVSTLAIHDANTVRDMESGKNQVSNGYDCDLLMQPGISPEGERYDAVQTNILGNHLAIVHGARAGKEAAARMDAACMIEETDTQPRIVRTDGATYMDLTQALAALAAAQEKLGATAARADKAENDLKELRKRVDTLDAELANAKELATKAETARKDAMDAQAGFVAARVALLSAAAKVLRTDEGEAVDCSKLSDREIKLSIIKHVTDADCDVDSAGKKRSDDYINARFDGAIERAAESADTFRAANDVIELGRKTDGKGRTDAEKAYDDMVKANREGWKDPKSYAAPATK